MALATGLVILCATYGPAKSSGRSESSSASKDVVDVTIALQALVHNSQLNIPAGSSKVRSPHALACAPLSSSPSTRSIFVLAIRLRALFLVASPKASNTSTLASIMVALLERASCARSTFSSCHHHYAVRGAMRTLFGS